jgi:hypothetical protein
MEAFPSSCSAKYILKQCQCLTDPMDVYSTVCAYVSKENGLVYPCDPGCCKFSCKNQDPNISRQEVRPAYGVTLPAGFGTNVPQSDKPSEFPGMSSFVDPQPRSLIPGAPLITPESPFPDNPYPNTPLLPDALPTAPPPPEVPIWKVLLIALVPLVVAIIAACFL